MKRVTVSAPGKLMLFGEHAVVYGHPCIVTAVDQRLFVTIELDTSAKLTIDAPDVGIKGYEKPLADLGKGEVPKGAKFIEFALKNAVGEIGEVRGMRVQSKSEFSSTLGFGSSSAVTVCMVAALNALFQMKFSKKKQFTISYKTVIDVQGKGSGFDIASALYGGTVYFVAGGKRIEYLIPPRHSGKRSASRIDSGQARMTKLPLSVGDTGMKADTVTLVNQIGKKRQSSPVEVGSMFAYIAEIVELARNALIDGDWITLGDLMNFNQGYLEALGVSSEKLEDMIGAARSAGAYGAKLSGAGGGDCMIALTATSNKQQVTRAIESVGGRVVEVETNAEGVRVEQ